MRINQKTNEVLRKKNKHLLLVMPITMIHLRMRQIL